MAEFYIRVVPDVGLDLFATPSSTPVKLKICFKIATI